MSHTAISLPILSSQDDAKRGYSINLLQRIAATFLALSMPELIETKIMAYMLNYSVSGYYYAGKGAREQMMRRLEINKTQYSQGIKKLIKYGVIKKCRNGSGSQYHYYELFPKTDLAVKIMESNGLKVTLDFKT